MKEALFDNPRNVKIFLFLFYASLVILLFAELFVEKHPYFKFEGFFSFSAVFGYLAGVVIIFLARIFRLWVGRDENYYNENENE